jgi:V-type sodium ATPase, I subunit
MAIAKMNKVMLIAPTDKQNDLLDAIQELQSLEVTSLEQAKELFTENSIALQEADAEEMNALQQKFEGIHAAITFVEKNQKQPSLIQKLKTPREQFALSELQKEVQNWDTDALVEHVESIRNTLRKKDDELKELREKETLLRKWSALDFYPKDIFKHPYTKTKMGTIPQATDNAYLDGLKESELISVHEVYHTREEIGVLVTYPRKAQQAAKEELAKAHFSIVWYAFEEAPSVELEKNLKAQQAVVDAKKKVLEDLQEEKDLLRKLQLSAEVTYNELQKEQAKNELVNGQHVFVLQGWLTTKAVDDVEVQLKEKLGEGEYVFLPLEIAEEEYEEVPTVLENNAFLQPFENLTEMYGLPKYGELDPTPYTAPFYLVFFGMMAADLGYGALLWLGTFIMLKFFHFDKGMNRNLKFFHLLSYPVMIWGIIFGSAFGADLPFQPLSLSKDLITIMILSIIFGVIQIMVGLSLGAYSNLKKKAYVDAYTSHLGWLAIITGIILYVLGSMVLNISWIATIGSSIAIIAAVAIVVVTVLSSENKWGGLASGLYNLYGISGYVADVVSYTRLMALAVSGGSIASAFNMLVGFLPPVARFTAGIFLIVALQGLNIFLSFLGAYVHGLRLQFVEFFGKFYDGGGHALKPFKTYEKYVDIKQQKSE